MNIKNKNIIEFFNSMKNKKILYYFANHSIKTQILEEIDDNIIFTLIKHKYYTPNKDLNLVNLFFKVDNYIQNKCELLFEYKTENKNGFKEFLLHNAEGPSCITIQVQLNKNQIIDIIKNNKEKIISHELFKNEPCYRTFNKKYHIMGFNKNELPNFENMIQKIKYENLSNEKIFYMTLAEVINQPKDKL